MRNHWRFAVRAVITMSVVVIVIAYINRAQVSKHFANSNWPETTTALDFYELDENSVDVLFLGSSHAVSAFIPQELYNVYGITSYNLAMEQQSLVVTYYWLKEALQTQQPEVVVLDAYILFTYKAEEALNSSEGATRLAIDFMQMGKVKREAIASICDLDENQSVISYYLTNVRFHTRWKSMSESDFLFEEFAGLPGLMGYSTASNGTVSATYEPFEDGSSDETVDMVPLMEEYLIKIINLCKEEDIDLVLVKTPSTAENIGKYNTLSAFADEYDIPFYDFNEKTLYEDLKFEFSEDMVDNGHVSLNGAIKITDYIGQILQSKYDMSAHESEAWEENREVYDHVLTDSSLCEVTDLKEYLSILKENEDRYTIFLSVKDEASKSLSEDIQNQLMDLGLSADWSDAYRKSYYAVIDKGTVLTEEMSEEKISGKGSFRNGRTFYSITSAGYSVGNTSSITIGSTEYSINKRGLNIVIYDNERLKVVDQVCFDTFSEDLTATR